MAQVLKLKRTAVQGKVPTTTSLELGELAINTFDGKLYFEKDDGTPSVQTILVTDATITGSINLIGAVSASYFKGDGSNLTNLPNADVSQVATITASFDNQSNISVVHNFDSRNIIVSVYDTAYSQIIPSSVTLTNNNTADIVLSSAQSGFAVVAKGGHIVSGSLVQEVTEVATISASFNGESTIDVTHSFNSKNIIISVYDTNDSQIIPSSVTLTNLNTARIILSSPQSGYVVVAKGGHLVTAVGTISYNNLTDIPEGILSGSISGAPAGTISGSSQLTSSFDTRYTLSGSVVQTSWDTLTSKPSGIVSGSSQVINIIDSLNSKTGSYATTGSNLFVGTQIHSGSIIPATDNVYDLGSLEYQWRDIFVSSGSLYIDGTKVLGSTNQELQITTDTGQSIKILEEGSDNITLQTADGDVELKSSGGGDILLDPTAGLISVKGTLQVQDGNKITSSGGNSVVFGNNVVISGSIESVGTINGINLNTFSSSVASTLSNQNSATSSYETKGSGIVSGSSQITISSTTGFTTYSSSVDSRIATEKGRVDAILLASDADKDSFAEIVTLINAVDTSNDSTFASFYTGSTNRLNSLETFTSSIDTTIKTKLNVENVVSGSSQIVSILSPLNTFSASVESKNTTLGTYTASLETKNSTLATYTGSINTQLSNLNGATSSYETKGRGIVSGSSQITLSSTTGYGSVLNQAVLTSSSPTFAGTTINGSATISNTLNINSGLQFRWNGAFRGQIVDYNSYGGGSDYSPFITSETSLAFGVAGNTTKALNITSNGNTTFAANVLPATNGTQDLGSSSYRWGGVYIGGLDASGDVTTGAVSTTSNNVGVRINHGNNSGGYGRIRFYENTSNISTIHSFSTSWGTSFSAQSRGALNLEGYNGVTFGDWNNPDFYVTRSSGNSYIKGTLTVGSTLTENSSLRYKENVETINNGLDKVLQMRGVSYEKKNTGVKEIGVIAEEIYEVLPELVLKNEEGEIDSVSYSRLTAVLIEAIKEQQKQIEELKALIK